MAETRTVVATARHGLGKGAARSVRREGRVPGVIYGGGEAAQAISLDFKTINQLIYAGHFLTKILWLDVEGQKERVIPRDYQLDVVKDTPLHVDFLRLRPGSTLRVDVPVHFVNHEASPGLKRGGTLNIVRHAVEMRVPADAIPDGLTVDLTGVDFNDSIHISALEIPEGCKPVITGRDFTIATLAPPTTVTEEPAAAAPAATAATTAAPAAAATAKPAAAKPAAKK